METENFLRSLETRIFISYKTFLTWTLHTPGLSQLESFMWGYTNDNAFKNEPYQSQNLCRR